MKGIDISMFVASDERLLLVDGRMSEMLLEGSSRVAGLRLEDLVQDEERSLLLDCLAELGSSGESSIVTRLRREGAAALEVEMHLWASELDQRRIIVGVVRDLGSLRELESQDSQLQRQIEQAAQEWRMTFDVVETPIIIIGSDGLVKRINHAARMVTGKNYEEIVNHPAENLGGEEPWATVRELAQAVLDRSSPATGQVKLGDGRIWDVLAIPFPLPSGARLRVLIAAWDVTQVVELQSSLDNARSMAEIGALVAGVAHEVRNPLFAVSATLDALEQACEGRYQEHFSILHEQIARMAKLMQHLLDYGRPSRPRFGYEERIERVVELSIASHAGEAEARGVTIEKVLEAEPATLFFDPDRIGRALDNVIHNAVLHSPEGGVVVVRLLRSDEKHQSWMLIRVEDDGPGFSSEDLDRVFEPFFTRREGGTGLGLSMVRQIAEEHGGKVWVENRPSGGAAVVMRLPIHESESDDGDGGARAEE